MAWNREGREEEAARRRQNWLEVVGGSGLPGREEPGLQGKVLTRPSALGHPLRLYHPDT